MKGSRMELSPSIMAQEMNASFQMNLSAHGLLQLPGRSGESDVADDEQVEEAISGSL
jgi:hypothetical protein